MPYAGKPGTRFQFPLLLSHVLSRLQEMTKAAHQDEGVVVILVGVMQVHAKDARDDTHYRHTQRCSRQQQLQLQATIPQLMVTSLCQRAWLILVHQCSAFCPILPEGAVTAKQQLQLQGRRSRRNESAADWPWQPKKLSECCWADGIKATHKTAPLRG